VNVRSIALTTELALVATRGRITDRGGYLVVETPDDPGYYHGNLLVLPAPPQVGEVSYWTRKFQDELGGNPAIRHVTLWWDGTTGDQGAGDELRAAGFSLDTRQVMVADSVDATPAPLPIRELSPDEVLATADLGWALGDRHDQAYRQFLQRRAAWHRDLVLRGIGHFYGAFDPAAGSASAALQLGGSTLVASLGIVRLVEVGRYQDVQTLPAYRKRGLARALLARAAHDAITDGAERVVIVTEPGSDAARLYARAGFRTIERIASACRYPSDISRPIKVRA
jgi:GNAT superfamily N-acetyltransferase